MPRRAGTTVLLRRFDVAGDQSAGLAPRLGDGHGVADAGIVPAPAHHVEEEVGPNSGGLDCQRESDHHVVADFVARGLAARPRRAKVDFSFMLAAPCSGHAAER